MPPLGSIAHTSEAENRAGEHEVARPFKHDSAATPTAQAAGGAVPAAKQKSCVTCRQRKVRCDKQSPCSNCRRADIPCVLPPTERPPRWARRLKQQQQQQQAQQQAQQLQHPQLPSLSQNGQPQPTGQCQDGADIGAIMDRLRQLEALVRDLSAANALTPGRSGGEHAQATADQPLYRRLSGQQPAAPVGERLGRLVIDDEVGAMRHETDNRAAARAAMAVGGDAVSLSDGDYDDDDDSDAKLSEHGGHEGLRLTAGPGHGDAAILTPNTSASNAEASQNSSTDAAHSYAERNAFFFGHNLQPPLGDAKDYQPLPSQIPFLFQVYVINVNMLVQVVHVPTINECIARMTAGSVTSIGQEKYASVASTAGTPKNTVEGGDADESAAAAPDDGLSPATEALMFAIYYAAVISMEEEDVVKNFGMSGSELSLRYRIGMELSLARANFLEAFDLEIVQALAIFLMLCRRYDSPRYAWMLTGLVIRMATALGLHRDGSNFGSSLTPFEIERRRRIWWTVCALDARSSEDQDIDLTILPNTFDTHLPLNLNDGDISPETQAMPDERDELTDTSYALLNFEVTRLTQRMMASAKEASMANGDGAISEQFLQEQNKMIEEVHQKLELRYLRYSPDTTSVIYWTSVTITRQFMAKMTLLLNLPRLLHADKKTASPDPYPSHDEDLRMRLLTCAIEVAEYNDALKTERACRRWRWLCETFTQWHTIAFILMETGRRPWDPAVERAWSALHLPHLIPAPPKSKTEAQAQAQSSRPVSVSSGSTGGRSNGNSHKTNKSTKSNASETSQFFWLPLRRLMARARRHRASELARLRSDVKAARDLEIAYDLAVADGRSRPQSNPGAVDVFRQQWRRLVGLDPTSSDGSSSANTSSVRTPADMTTERSTQPKDERLTWDTTFSFCTSRALFVGRSDAIPPRNVYYEMRDKSVRQTHAPGPPMQAFADLNAVRSDHMPAPNSIDEYILASNGQTPRPDPVAFDRFRGADPWKLWNTPLGEADPTGQENGWYMNNMGYSAAMAAAAAPSIAPNLSAVSGLQFVGDGSGMGMPLGQFHAGMAAAYDPSAAGAVPGGFFEEDLDIDMDVDIDWTNWFESAKGV